jgi:O-antigen/teichoic acid export membrane protein
MVLITSGRSSWNLYNGLAQVVVNVGIDVWLIPRLGITGAAIGWAAAIAVGNLVPLVQLATVLRLQPFGRGTLIAVLISTACFGVFPFAVREVFGDGFAPFAAGVVGGGLLLLIGLWRFRSQLSLSSLPGAAALSGRLLRTTARA